MPAAAGSFFGQAMAAGRIYAVAGTGRDGYTGDGGPARSAELDRPFGMAFDGSGNLIIADAWNNRIRVLAAVAGTFYGQPMTAGDIYTIAGTASRGSPGTAARRPQPPWTGREASRSTRPGT